MWKRVCWYAASAVMGMACAFLLSGIFTIVEVSGSAMEPAVESESKVLVNKLAYHEEYGDAPKAGSLVAFKSDVYGEDGDGRNLVRRITAVAGDTVEIKNSILYVNDKPYTEYMAEAANMEPMDKKRLGKYQIFVLSDDRRMSMDSRNEAIGMVDIRECTGQVCFK